MNIHKNARTTPRRRPFLVRRVLREHWPVSAVALAFGVSDNEAIHFSMTVRTSTGFGDITPLARQARSICVVEQVAGAPFVAILIARLAGVYPPQRGEAG